MSDPKEQPEAAQQEAGSPQDDTESKVKVTDTAKQRAQDLGVDLTKVEGTGSGGSITVKDVEKNAQQESDATASAVEEASLSRRACTLEREPRDPAAPLPDEIHMQYVVLKATLAGSREGGVLLQIIDDKGTAVQITGANFPSNPHGFFAPMPPSAPVKWEFPPPQPLLLRRLTGTCQQCGEGQCDLGRGIDAGIQSVSQRPGVPSGADTPG